MLSDLELLANATIFYFGFVQQLLDSKIEIKINCSNFFETFIKK